MNKIYSIYSFQIDPELRMHMNKGISYDTDYLDRLIKKYKAFVKLSLLFGDKLIISLGNLIDNTIFPYWAKKEHSIFKEYLENFELVIEDNDGRTDRDIVDYSTIWYGRFYRKFPVEPSTPELLKYSQNEQDFREFYKKIINDKYLKSIYHPDYIGYLNEIFTKSKRIIQKNKHEIFTNLVCNDLNLIFHDRKDNKISQKGYEIINKIIESEDPIVSRSKVRSFLKKDKELEGKEKKIEIYRKLIISRLSTYHHDASANVIKNKKFYETNLAEYSKYRNFSSSLIKVVDKIYLPELWGPLFMKRWSFKIILDNFNLSDIKGIRDGASSLNKFKKLLYNIPKEDIKEYLKDLDDVSRDFDIELIDILGRDIKISKLRRDKIRGIGQQAIAITLVAIPFYMMNPDIENWENAVLKIAANLTSILLVAMTHQFSTKDFNFITRQISGDLHKKAKQLIKEDKK